MAMAARPGAVDKAYIVGSSLLMALCVLRVSEECHGWSVSDFVLTLKEVIDLDECPRHLNTCV